MYVMRHACPRRSGQDYRVDSTPDFLCTKQENVIRITASIGKIIIFTRKFAFP
jgi:hypothetical protein